MHREVIRERAPLLHLIGGEKIARYDYVIDLLVSIFNFISNIYIFFVFIVFSTIIFSIFPHSLSFNFLVSLQFISI